MCKARRLPSRVRRLLLQAALLHDVGKLELPVEMLRKPGPLSAAETQAMEAHPARGCAMLAGEFAAPVVRSIAGHHERLDGSGYPLRLSGTQIAGGTRLLAVCDALAAMTEERAYAERFTWAAALARLLELSERYDAKYVRRFCCMAKARHSLGD